MSACQRGLVCSKLFARPRPGQAGQLLGSCIALGLGVGMVLVAALGSDGYSSLVNGISRATGAPYAEVNWTLGFTAVLLARLRGVRPGLGTITHPVVVGLTVNAVLDPPPTPGSLAAPRAPRRRLARALGRGGRLPRGRARRGSVRGRHVRPRPDPVPGRLRRAPGCRRDRGMAARRQYRGRHARRRVRRRAGRSQAAGGGGGSSRYTGAEASPKWNSVDFAGAAFPWLPADRGCSPAA